MGSGLFIGQADGRSSFKVRAGLILLGVLAFIAGGVSGSAHRASTQDPVVQSSVDTSQAQDQDAATAAADPDTDGDGMPDPWEQFFGLNPNSAADATADPDGDGLTNLQEFQNKSHPKGNFKRYFAEGSTGQFFDTDIGLLNLSTTDVAHVSIAYLGESGVHATQQVTLQPRQRQTISVDALPGPGAAIGAVVESDVQVAADRFIEWGGNGYGSTVDSGEAAPATTWYLAEGATGLFEMYYLLLNPGTTPANVTVKYLREVGAPITKTYNVAARSRATIFVNSQDLGLVIASTGAVVTSNVPIVAERSMYFSILRLFGAGTGGSGVSQLSTRWYFAEGATGPFFDEFLTLLNPSTSTATATVTYRLTSGVTLTKNYTIDPERRRTIYLNLEAQVDPALAQLANATLWVQVDSNVPIAADRVMWWPHTFLWDEGAASHGVITPGTAFAVPEGSHGGPHGDQTYILIANTANSAGQVRLTYIPDSGAPTVHTLPIGALQRLSVNVGTEFSVPSNSRFSVLVDSLGSPGVPLVVEYSRFASPSGVPFAAGGTTVAVSAEPPDTAPSVTTTTPANGAAGVNITSNITVTFSEPVNVTASAFTLQCPSGTPIALTNTTASPATTFTLDPNTNLPSNTPCVLTVVANQVTDVDTIDPPDNMAANHVVNFTTESDAAPTVTATTPTNGATGVTINSNLSVTFSEPVNVTASAFTLECPAGSPIALTNLTASPATTFTLDPATPMPANGSCVLTVVANQVMDQDAVDPPDTMAANVVVNFQTEAEASPSVSTTTPVNGATQVATNTDLVITFTEPVNVTGNWFQIVCATSGTRNVADTVVSGGPTAFTINPNADFAQGEVCTTTVVAAQVADQDSVDPPDTMAANFVFSFTTDVAPAVTATTPTNGATQVANNTNITVTFSEPVNVTGSWFQVVCATSGTRNVGDTVVTGGPTAFSIDPNADFANGELCTVTITAAQVSDQDSGDPPDTLAANYVFSFTIDNPPSVTATTPTNGSTTATTTTNITVTFDEPVNVTGNWFQIVCTTTGTRNVADTVVTGGPTVFTIDPNTDLAPGETCTTTVFAAQVADQDTGDPPDTMASDFVFSFSVDAAPSVTATTPTNGSTVASNTDLTITFSEPVNVTGNWFQIVCTVSGTRNVVDTVVTGGPTTFTINPNVDFAGNESCATTVFAAQVSDQDGNDPPDNMLANFGFSFSTDGAPAVSATTPTNGATNQASNIDLTVTFNEPVNVTGNWFQVVCTVSGTRNVADTGVTGGPTTFTINPNADFTQGESCTVTVFAAQVSDQDAIDPPDNMAANFVFSFTIDAAPAVSSTVPTNGATNILPGTNITVNFTESVNATTSSFDINCGSGSVPYTLVTASPASTFVLDPNADLTGTSCTVTVVAAQITDADSNDPPDNMLANHVFSFTLEQAPAVTTTVPTNGATGVLTSALITVNFTEAVTASVGSFTLECPIGSGRTFTVGGSGTSTITLTPTGGLPAGAICQVTVLAAGIADVDSADPPDNLAANYVFSFAVPPDAQNDGYNAIGHVFVDSNGLFTVLSNDLFAEPLTNITFNATTANGGTVVMNGVGPTAGQFTYNPPVGHSGPDTFTYTITNPAGSDTATVTFTVATPIWFINNNAGACSSGCDGRQVTPFTSVGAFQAINNGTGANPAAGDHIFVHESSTAHTGNITLLSGQRLIGQDAGAALLTITGHVLPPGSSVPTTDAANATFATLGGTVRLNDNVVVRGFNIATSGGTTAIDDPVAAITGMSVSEVRITATNSPGVTLSNTTGSVSLFSLTANNSTHGISLSNTNGAFTVLGSDGGDAGTDPDAGTGGTITNTSSRGAAFVNHVGAISLGGMNFTNAGNANLTTAANCGNPSSTDNAACNAAIHLVNTSTSVTLNTITVNGGAQVGINGSGVNNLTMTNIEVMNVGDESLESGVMLRNVSGTGSVLNGNFHDNESRQFHIANTTGTLSSFTIRGSTFANAPAPNGSIGLLIEAHNPGTTMTVDTGGLVGGQGVNINNLFSNGWQAVAATNAVLNATLRGSTATNVNGHVVQASLNSTINTTIEGNSFIAGANTLAGVLSVKTDGGGSMTANIISNVIGQNGVAGSGTACAGCNGMFINPRGTGSSTLNVIGNTIQNVNGQGIMLNPGEAASQNVNAVITGNLIHQPGPQATTDSIALEVRNGVISGDATCLAVQIGGAVTPAGWPSTTPNAKNQILGVWSSGFGGEDVFLWQRFSTVFRLPGLSGGAAAFVQGNNEFGGTPVVTTLGTITAGASCP